MLNVYERFLIDSNINILTIPQQQGEGSVQEGVQGREEPADARQRGEGAGGDEAQGGDEAVGEAERRLEARGRHQTVCL